MRAVEGEPALEQGWPWETLPASRWLGRAGPAGVVLFWAWVLSHWPLTTAGALLAASIVGVALLLRPGVGLPLLALAVPFGSLRNVNLGAGTVGPQDVLLLAIAGAWLIRQLARRSLRLRWPSFAGAGLLLLAAMLASFLPATSLAGSLKELVKWAELWLAAVLVLNLADGVDVALLVGGLLVAGAAEGLVGIRQVVAGSGPAGFLLMGRFMRASGTFGQPNPFGGYLGLTLPLAAGILLTAWPARGGDSKERRRGQAAWFVALAAAALMGAGLLASWSRGAWLGAAVALAAVVVARGGAWLRGVPAAILLGVLVCLLVRGRVPLPGALEQRFADMAADLVTSDVRSVEVTDANFAVLERTAHWLAAWGMFSAHPWTGVGLGNYALAYEKYALPRWQDPLGHAHNYYLNIAAEAGLPGLAAYLLWVGAGLWVAWRAVRASRGLYQGLALGVLGMWVHLSAHNLFDNLYVHGMAIQIGLLLGLAAWIVAGCEVKGRAPDGPQP